MDIIKPSPPTKTGAGTFHREKACIDSHMVTAHHMPNMRDIPGRQ